MLSALADPLGSSALQKLTRYWTTAERDTRFVGFPALLVWSRVVWLAVAATLLAVLHARFRLAHPAGDGRRRRAQRAIVDSGSERALSEAVPRVAGAFGLRTRARQTFAVARNSLEEIAGAARLSWPCLSRWGSSCSGAGTSAAPSSTHPRGR